MKITQKHHRKCGFTLIEILVVMSIIGILAGLLFPGVVKAIENAKKTRTTNACHQLKNAITAYYSDYRRYPLPNGFDSPYHDASSDEFLMNILVGLEPKKNPRGTTYFSGRNAKRIGKGRYNNGIHIDSNGAATLWDDFGHHFGIRIGTGSKSLMPNPAVEVPNLSGPHAPSWGRSGNPENHSTILTESVAVWSSGKEEDLISDNLKTWE